MEQGKSLNIRDLALDGVMLVLEDGQFSHLVVRQALEKYGFLSLQERRFFLRLVQGTVERQIELDWILGQYSKIPSEKMRPVIRNILRMTVYQIYYMDGVPDSAACNEAVKLAGKRGFSSLKGFVNGVCRSVARGKGSCKLPPDWSIVYSMPDWIIDCYKKSFGSQQTEQILSSFFQNGKNQVTVHCHTGKTSLENIIASLEREHVTLRRDPVLPEVLFLRSEQPITELSAFQEGLIQVQNRSSILACMAAGVKPGFFCIDVCAAPGGKSVFLANAAGDTGTVISRDLSEGKLAYIEENRRRTGFSQIIPQVWDATVPDDSMKDKADLVFADLPCSGLGVLREKPDIKYHQTPEAAAELAGLQRQILSVVQSYVKPGGTLLFSTCTVNPAENQENAAWFLSRYPKFVPEDLSLFLPKPVQADTLKQGYLQIAPDASGDGFFFARFKRKE